MDKKEIRSSMIEKLKMIPAEERDIKSKLITEKLIQTKVWNKARIIATTMSMEHEVNTSFLIQAAWNEDKTIVVPKCIHKTKEMKFYKITSFSDLEKGYFDILEPKVEQCVEIVKDDIDLIIVPGVAYTKEGSRIGYGGGYFDRYLENYQKDILSLAFQCQMTTKLPFEQHDIHIPLIIND
jgi:5-formyltetrahydrofolate cyclo-ligase